MYFLRTDEWPEGSIVDTKTPNRSFVEYAMLLKAMNVENWYWPLALMQPELQGVDPHDPNLSMEIKAKIIVEITVNPAYWFREIARVPQDGGECTPFRVNRGTGCLIWVFFNNIDLALLMIRQQGKTVGLIQLILLLMRTLKNSKTILLTRGSDLRTETITEIKKHRDLLPKWLWRTHKEDADNTEIFTYKSRENRLLTCIAQSSKDLALNAGRGMTTARIFSDEPAFTKFIRTMLPAAFGSTGTARRNAEAAGIPYGNVLTTTPGKRDEPDGKYVYDLFNDGFLWTERLMDCKTRDALFQMVRDGSKGDRLLIHAPFTHKQLGMSDRDFYLAVSAAGGTHEEKLRDFGLQWTAGSLVSPLTVEEAEMINDSTKDPDWVEIFPSLFVLRWYYTPELMTKKMEVPHILGVDTSDAVGRDNISLVMVNSQTLETGATGIVNQSNLVIFANWLADVLIKYPTVVLVIERKSSAPTIIDAVTLRLVAAGINPYRRIFNSIIQTREDVDLDYKEMSRANANAGDAFFQHYRKWLGFVTTGEKRKLLYGEVLQNAVRMAGNHVRDKQLASEILGLVVKDGRIDHKASGNDDCVVAWLLAIWFMLHGNRLGFYGVSNRLIMKRDALGVKDIDEDALAKQEQEDEEQALLMDRIDDLCRKMVGISNPYMRKNLDRQLSTLLANLNLDTSRATSIGELQELIRNDKLTRKRGI